MMDPFIVCLIIVVCISIGLLVGLLSQNILPSHHQDAPSKDTVMIAAGMLATLTALVLGLLVSSAKGSFDTTNTGIASAGTKIILFDRTLANYGPETNEVRHQLRQTIAGAIDRIWFSQKTNPDGSPAAESGTGMDTIQRKLNELTQKTKCRNSFSCKPARWPMISHKPAS